MAFQFNTLLKTMGPLRISLYILVLCSFIFTPSNVDHVTTVYATIAYFMMIFAVIFFMLLMLDAIVSKIFMTEKQGDELKYYRILVWWDIALGIAMLIKWIPFYLNLNVYLG